MAQLEEYKRKRRFEKTPEPAGKPAAAGGSSFVVQKHAARRLHYDFRLEINGVLVSWAVPKGPALNPADKRLAVQTEDHPLDYAGFEGVIPEGQYGAGAVMVWDRGLYSMEGEQSVEQQLKRGELKFALRGEKLRGGFVLVKIARGEKGNEWLLIKHKDSAADTRWEIDKHDGSVLTGRTLTEIAEGLPAAAGKKPLQPAELEGARRAAMPARLSPMLATLADKPFSDPEWLYEIKWDGVRALAFVKGGRVEWRSRTGQNITAQYPELAVLPERLLAREAILDGEVVVLDASGCSDFERLQSRMNTSRPSPAQQKAAPVHCYLFDLLYAGGYDLRAAPLLERKRLLKRLLDPRDPFCFSDHQLEQGRELFALARQQGLEGIVGKHARSAYVSRRSPFWLKFKVRRELDAVVGGWTAPRAGREFFGALSLGLYEGKALRYIGGVGSGFTRQAQQEILEQLEKLVTARCAFDPAPKTDEKPTWTAPALVARVEHAGWTQERRLRQPSFLGLRAGADPKECLLEGEAPSAAAPAIVSAPAIAGRVLTKKSEIERELFAGRAENATLELDGQPVRLSNLNKVYFPGEGYTKRDLLAYYYRIAPRLLPYLKDRPLVLRRYPDGIAGEAFFQKDAGEGAPPWMETVAVFSDERREEINYFVANNRAALLYLTNLGCIDHNPWSSRRDQLELPDWVFFDLDPAEGTDFAAVVEVAQAVEARLRELGLVAFAKTSGATGLHLYLPLVREYSYEQARTFAEIVGRLVARDLPGLVTQERAVEKRPRGKVLIDAAQNAYGRPLAAPFTVRAFPRAPVSAPLAAGELRRGLKPEKMNIKTILARLEKSGDPWCDFWKRRQRLDAAIQRLGAEVSEPREREKEKLPSKTRGAKR